MELVWWCLVSTFPERITSLRYSCLQGFKALPSILLLTFRCLLFKVHSDIESNSIKNFYSVSELNSVLFRLFNNWLEGTERYSEAEDGVGNFQPFRFILMTKTATAQANGGNLSRSALRRQREREERYQTILNAAETLFVREGYHQTSINKIADLAEVSVGTVYFYFKNKEDLLIQLLDGISYLFRSRVGAEFRNSESTLEGFMAAGLMFFNEFCRNYPEKVAIMYRESIGQSPLLDEHRKKLHDKSIKEIGEALKRMSENMGFSFPSEISVEVISVSIMGIYQSIASHYLVSQNAPENLEQIGKDAVAFLIGGIKDMCNLR